MPATAMQPKTFRYEVELDDGQKFQLELDAPVPENEAGKRMLEELVHEQLGAKQTGIPIPPLPFAEVGRGVVGGLRDFGQQFLNLPVELLNVILASASPDPPGPPGTRRPLFPEFQAPQLPGPGEPKSGLERGVRTGTTIAADVASIAIPALRAATARRAARRTPMLFEKSLVKRGARELTQSKPQLQFEPRSPASRGSFGTRPTPTVAETSGILKAPPSQSARNLARLFEFNADDISKMNLERATNARRRIMTSIPDYPLYQEGTPIFELLQRLEQRILSFR